MEEWLNTEGILQFDHDSLQPVYDEYDEWGRWYWVYGKEFPLSEINHILNEYYSDLPPIYDRNTYVEARKFTPRLIRKQIEAGLETIHRSSAYSCCSAYVYVASPDGSRTWQFRLSNHPAMTNRSMSDAEYVIPEEWTDEYFDEDGYPSAKGEEKLSKLIYLFFGLDPSQSRG